MSLAMLGEHWEHAEHARFGTTCLHVCLCVGKKVGVKRRFFMSLGMSSGHTANSDP